MIHTEDAENKTGFLDLKDDTDEVSLTCKASGSPLPSMITVTSLTRDVKSCIT